jgi:putative ABC transport system permease protein
MMGGIASGVALIAALGVVNQSVLTNFRATLERAAGKAALQVTLGTGEVGFDEAFVETVAADPGVDRAFGMVRGTLVARDDSGEVLQLFGIDLVSDAIDSYDVRVVGDRPDEIELLNDPSAVLLTEEYAARRRIGIGDRVPFATTMGIRQLHVRGLLHPEGIATVFGGNLAIMDLPAAQRLVGKDRRVDQIDIIPRSGSEVAAMVERLTVALPRSLSVTRPAHRGERFERVIGAFQAMLDGLSLLCLLAGVFIVYNTSATAVTQRARDLAILIALGAERRTIFGLVVVESLIVGIVASAIGVAAGLGLARLLIAFVAQSMGVIYQTRFAVDTIAFAWSQMTWYVTLGTAGSVVAALGPARKAGALDPLELMRPDFRERLAITAPNRLLVGLASILLVSSGGALWIEQRTQSIAWGNTAALLLWLTAIVVSIPVMNGFSVLLRPVLPRVFGFQGRVAIEGLTRSPGRTGVTTAVIALSLTLAVTVSSVARSFRESERDWFILMGDLVVSAVATEGGWLETPLDPTVGDVLRQTPGVSRVETYRVLPGQAYESSRIAVVAVSPGFIETEQFRRQLVEGDYANAVGAVRDDGGVIVSDNFAERFGVGVGDDVTLPTPNAIETFRVTGIVAADYSGDQGSVIMGRDRFARIWGDMLVSHFNVFLEPGADLEEVRRELARTLGQDYVVKVLTVPQTLAYHQGMVDRAFVFTYAIQLLVVAVTLAGIFDLLTTQIIERRREVGVFRALGADGPDVARAIRLEATTIGVAGALLGAVLAVGTSLMWVRVNFRILIGYVLEHHFAALTAAWCVLLAGGVAMIAGHLAARAALRQPVLDSLRCE